jgi:hypothetical protein
MNKLLFLLLLAGPFSAFAQQAPYVEVRVALSRSLPADTLWYAAELASDEEMQVRESQQQGGHSLRILSWAELQAMAARQGAEMEPFVLPKSYHLPAPSEPEPSELERGEFRFTSLKQLNAFHVLMLPYDNAKGGLSRQALTRRHEEQALEVLMAEAALDAQAQATCLAEALGRSLGPLAFVAEEAEEASVPRGSAWSWTFYPLLSALPGTGEPEARKTLKLSLRFRYELR